MKQGCILGSSLCDLHADEVHHLLKSLWPSDALVSQNYMSLLYFKQMSEEGVVSQLTKLQISHVVLIPDSGCRQLCRSVLIYGLSMQL